MVSIRAVDGRTAVIRDETISKIKGRGAIGPYTEVWGPSGSEPIQTAEPAEALIARLVLIRPLAALHVPNGETVYMKGVAVSMLRPATPFERGTPPPHINSIATVAGRYQALMEDFPTAHQILVAAGANLPRTMHTFTLDGIQIDGLLSDPSAANQTGEFSPW